MLEDIKYNDPARLRCFLRLLNLTAHIMLPHSLLRIGVTTEIEGLREDSSMLIEWTGRLSTR